MKSVSFLISLFLLLATASTLNSETRDKDIKDLERPPLQIPVSGRIDRKIIWSQQMQDSITVDIWLPQIYLDNDSARFPVIYMHDGQNLFDAATTWNHQSWEMDSVVTQLVAEKAIVPPVVVGVHSVAQTRIADLMPEAPFENHPDLLHWLDNFGENKGLRGDEYAAFISTTLRDTVNSNYRVLTDRDDTMVMGSSMGGLISIYMLCEYPEIYGGAACLSTHWIGDVEGYSKGDERFPKAMYDYLKLKLPGVDSHKIYYDRGTETVDQYYGKWNDSIIALTQQAGFIPGETLQTCLATGAPHEEQAWKKRVSIPLIFLLSHHLHPLCDGLQ